MRCTALFLFFCIVISVRAADDTFEKSINVRQEEAKKSKKPSRNKQITHTLSTLEQRMENLEKKEENKKNNDEQIITMLTSIEQRIKTLEIHARHQSRYLPNYPEGV